MIREHPEYQESDVPERVRREVSNIAMDAVPPAFRSFLPENVHTRAAPHIREAVAAVMNDRELQTVIAYNLLLTYAREGALSEDMAAPAVQALSHNLALIRAEVTP